MAPIFGDFAFSEPPLLGHHCVSIRVEYWVSSPRLDSSFADPGRKGWLQDAVGATRFLWRRIFGCEVDEILIAERMEELNVNNSYTTRMNSQETQPSSAA